MEIHTVCILELQWLGAMSFFDCWGDGWITPVDLAEASMVIVSVRLLATYTIRRILGLYGGRIKSRLKLSDGLTSYRDVFPCCFEARSCRIAHVQWVECTQKSANPRKYIKYLLAVTFTMLSGMIGIPRSG